MMNLSEKIEHNFAGKNIVVVGDIVADQFLRGSINRVSREAPVFILRHDETETIAGGAGNAACNVASLGGKATLVGIVGDDPNGNDLLDRLNESKVGTTGIIASIERETTTKLRVLGGQEHASKQQVIRIDYENRNDLDQNSIERINEKVIKSSENADAIIVSDYNYGVANPNTFSVCAKIAKEKDIPLIVDSRFRLAEFKNATSATPNEEEAEEILGKNFTEEDCIKLRKTLNLEALLITRGSNGMLLIEGNGSVKTIDVVGSKQPIDVTGAGDTVIAAYALGLASGLSFEEAANVANHAGGIVVMKKTTATATLNEVIDSMRTNSTNKFVKAI